MQRRRECRAISGILLLDKPAGMTSNAALQRVKRHLRACKAGHTGSLDPFATGLLPLCFGEASKVSGFLLDSDKHYRAEFHLGVETTTYDVEGDIIETRPVTVDEPTIRAALNRFVGWVDQVPPMYSALKLDGQPLYKRARAGLTVERAARRVQVHRLDLLSCDGDRLAVDISCSKGTYVRSLAHDLGEALGCGAHVSALRRVAAGGFEVRQAIGLESLEALSPEAVMDLLLGADTALAGWPSVELAAAVAQRLLCGNAVAAEAPSGWVRIYEQGGRFLGIGEARNDLIVPRRLISTVSDQR